LFGKADFTGPLDGTTLACRTVERIDARLTLCELVEADDW
jgi:hypothetical protein